MVSGGHTQLVEATAIGRYRLLGESLDDAARRGAFDKTAKILGPLSRRSRPGAAGGARGDPQRYRFPRPMTDRPGLDFSFSGLKTYTLNTLQRETRAPTTWRRPVPTSPAPSREAVVVETLVIKKLAGVPCAGV